MLIPIVNFVKDVSNKINGTQIFHQWNTNFPSENIIIIKSVNLRKLFLNV